MKNLTLAILILLIAIEPSSSQQSQIVDDSFYSPSLAQNIPMKIYLPPYHSTAGDPYRVYIFLHGGMSSNYTSHVSTMQPVLDQLINNPSLEFQPLVVVWAGVTWPGLGSGINSLNLHWYTNSIRNGEYESVISVDLFNWLDTCSYNISTVREKRGIGGFSMGGDGSTRIAIRHSDRVIAFISHCGAAARREDLSELSILLNETPVSPGGQYQFHPNNGVTSLVWFCESAAYSPNLINPNQPSWQLDFPLDSEGLLIPSVFDSLWIANHDAATLIQNPAVYTDSIYMYFDTRAGDYNKPWNDRFHDELNLLGIVHTYNIFPTGGHQLSADAVESGLMFLDSAMDRSTTTGVEPAQPIKSEQIELRQNYPNPFNPGTTIEFILPKAGFVTLTIYNVMGEKVATLVEGNLTSGIHNYRWDALGLASGIYFYRIRMGESSVVKKCLLLE